MKPRYLIFGLFIMVISSCTSTKSTVTEAQIKTLDAIMEKPAFTITSQWAQPQVTNAMNQLSNAGLIPSGSSAGNIDISGTTNYFKMEQDSVKAALPYFGERHFGSNYGSGSGIEFEGLANHLKIEKGPKSNYTVTFDINDKHSPSETYRVYITIWPNLNTNMTITSAQRNPIQYQGKLKNSSSKDTM